VFFFFFLRGIASSLLKCQAQGPQLSDLEEKSDNRCNNEGHGSNNRSGTNGLSAVDSEVSNIRVDDALLVRNGLEGQAAANTLLLDLKVIRNSILQRTANTLLLGVSRVAISGNFEEGLEVGLAVALMLRISDNGDNDDKFIKATVLVNVGVELGLSEAAFVNLHGDGIISGKRLVNDGRASLNV